MRRSGSRMPDDLAGMRVELSGAGGWPETTSMPMRRWRCLADPLTLHEVYRNVAARLGRAATARHRRSGPNCRKSIRNSLHVNGPWCVTFEWEEGAAFRVDLEQYH